MLISEFEKLWSVIFDAPAESFALIAAIKSELVAKGIVFTDGQWLIISDVLAKYRPDNQYKVKSILERDFLRWVIALDGDFEMKDSMVKIIDNIKLVPAHFSDIFCQCIWRIIVEKFKKGGHWGLPYLVDYTKENYGLGFISLTELVDFVVEKRTIEYRNDCLLPDIAEKIIMAHDSIETTLREQEGTVWGNKE
jgi:hypothetical protein